MRFLHLSDLHIGKSVNGFSMLEEQRHVFAQVSGFVESERPGAVVIAGDVYDRAVPGIEAVRLFDDFLTSLSAMGAPVLLVAGNHDSPERLSFASRLLSERGLYLYGAFDGGPRKVTLPDEYGEVNFWLLPFIKPSSLHGFFPMEEIETYDDAVTTVIRAADIDDAGRNVLVAHQFFTKAGLSPERSESELNPVGGLDAVGAAAIERFDYAALGHLHGAQKVGLDHIRYAGSPLKYSFSEVSQKKSVTLVELREKGDITIEALPLVPLHDMREIKGSLQKLTSDEIASLADREDYLRVTLTDEEEIVDPIGKVRSVYPNVMSLDFENTRTGIDLAALDPALPLERLSPYDLFRDFFLEVNGSPMNREQERTARELFEEEAAE